MAVELWDHTRVEPQIQYVTTSDGVSIAYYTMGEGPVLLWLMSPWSHLETEWRLDLFRAGYLGATEQFTLVRLDPWLRAATANQRDASRRDVEGRRSRRGSPRFRT